MISILALGMLAAGEFRVPRCDGAWQRRGDTVEIVAPLGGEVDLEWPGPVGVRSGKPFRALSADRIGFRPDSARSGVLRIKAPSGSPTVILWRALPVRDLEVRTRTAGTVPGPVGWDQALVESELRRLLQPAGLRIRLKEDAPVRILPAAWDLDGNSKLDLWMDESPDQASPEEAALHAALRQSRLVFPTLILFQDPLRLGWPLRAAVRMGDSLLKLGSSRALAWRDASGRTERYAVEGPRGDQSDPFTVLGYPADAIRVRAHGPRGGWKHDHPASDVVVRLGTGVPAFGSTDRSDSTPSPLIFLEPGATGDPIRCARVLAHELGHALGLSDVAAPGNLMSALMRMEVETPELQPFQVLQLGSRLDSARQVR